MGWPCLIKKVREEDYRDKTLKQIENQGNDSPFHTEFSRHVGGPDISAAPLGDVNPRHISGDYLPKRDCAADIARYCKNNCLKDQLKPLTRITRNRKGLTQGAKMRRFLAHVSHSIPPQAGLNDLTIFVVMKIYFFNQGCNFFFGRRWRYRDRLNP